MKREKGEGGKEKEWRYPLKLCSLECLVIENIEKIDRMVSNEMKRQKEKRREERKRKRVRIKRQDELELELRHVGGLKVEVKVDVECIECRM